MKGKITAKQQEILDYIKEMTLSRGYPPSVRELCTAVNLRSTSSVHSHLETLEKNGYIKRDPTKPRAIEILDDDFNLARREVVNIPVVGNVAAGEPLLAEQNIEQYFPLLPEFLKSNEVFMLRVRGDSMINCGIFDGDLLVVERTSQARDGEIVVAIIEDGATVKRFYRELNHIRLQPENDALDPIIVDKCEICGRVIGLFRTGIEYDIKRITEFDK
ncbi:MAG: transcriptional repressor LexA [Lachnospiraceae bacterium]|nr:transcriptional repressor LexA [Lachnospiraceae bacterium]